MKSDLFHLLRRGQAVRILECDGQWTLWRVIVVVPAANLVCWIRLSPAETVAHEWIALHEVVKFFEGELLETIETDPFCPLWLVSERAARYQAKRWRIVTAVLQHGEINYLKSPVTRARIIEEVSTQLMVPRSAVRKAMTLFYVRGMGPTALAPRTNVCGGPGKSRQLTRRKMPKPRGEWG